MQSVNLNRYIEAKHSLTEKPDPKTFFMHSHEICELFYFISGKGTYKIEGNDYPLKSGDILIMRPMEAHYISIDRNFPYERFVVNFNIEIFSDIDKNGTLMLPFTKRPSGKKNLYRAEDFKDNSYRVFIENMISGGSENSLNIIANLLPLLNEISIAISNKNESIADDTLDSEIVRYINRNICNELTLDGICGKFYISKPQLCRIFKNATGSTVWNYITVKRLAIAKKLIQNGNSPTKIYSQCGFTDYSAFYRAYHKKYGTSPSEKQKS